jgi:hypothetical protein
LVMMTHGSVSCLCSTALRGVVSPSGVILAIQANLLIHFIILCLN